MPYSHHSHSGQFCGHAKNTLEEVIQTAIAKGFHTFALTEHIPRQLVDFYPEEQDSHTEESLAALFTSYLTEATRLRTLYSAQISIPLGFESEWIRPSTHTTIKSLLETHKFDFFLGSLHHTHTHPIDFDRPMYERARAAAGGTDERLFEDYFDEQLGMLTQLRPPIVGHFDLIRLLSDHRDEGFEGMQGVWDRIRRNLEVVAEYGGLLELNSAGLRKGLKEPYPCLEVVKMFRNLGGGFVMSDDSHGIEQIGTNYARLLEFIQRAGIQEVFFVTTNDDGHKTETSSTSTTPKSPPRRTDPRFPHVTYKSISVNELVQLPFWSALEGGSG